MKTLGLWRQQAIFQRRRAFLSKACHIINASLSFLPCKNTDDRKALNAMGTNRITKIPTQS